MCALRAHALGFNAAARDAPHGGFYSLPAASYKKIVSQKLFFTRMCALRAHALGFNAAALLRKPPDLCVK
jgi:hypothetical protein